MSTATTHGQELTTLPLDTFWNWLVRHPNCILRAGTADAVLYDDDDLHWHFAADAETLFVQVIRGKRLMGEMLLDPERIAYVESFPEEQEGEFAFELIVEEESDRYVAFFFVLTHGLEEEEAGGHGFAVH